MVELLQNTSNLKKVQDKETRFLLTYLFLFLKQFSFTLKKIKILKVLVFLYFAYADDTSFFVIDEGPVIEVMNAFDKAKCEIAGIGILKGV